MDWAYPERQLDPGLPWASVTDVVPTSVTVPPLEIAVQAIQL
jgi:hypothetical protein